MSVDAESKNTIGSNGTANVTSEVDPDSDLRELMPLLPEACLYSIMTAAHVMPIVAIRANFQPGIIWTPSFKAYRPKLGVTSECYPTTSIARATYSMPYGDCSF